jgi:hypothetical protein
VALGFSRFNILSMRIIIELKRTVFTLCTLLLICPSIKAQVTIGADREPHAGAVLELVSHNAYGLLLPKLPLSNASDWGLGGSPVEGMTVYNENASTSNNLKGKGIYVWIEGLWRIANQIPCVSAPTLGAITLSNDKPAKNIVFLAWVDPVEGSTQYVWEIVGSGLVGYSNTNVISLAGSVAGDFIIKVKAVNACGVGNQAQRLVKIN